MRKRILLPSVILPFLSLAGVPAGTLSGESIGSPVAIRTVGESPKDRRGEGVLVPAATGRPSEAPGFRSSFGLDPVRPLVGEPVNGFPNWQERVIHEWINRARVDPQADLAGCGASCAENIGGCYTPQLPLIWSANAGRAARYHSAEMGLQSFFAHDSACTLVSNLNSLYPGSCAGLASCACVGGLKMCNPACTSWSARIGLFGASAYGEIIAAGYQYAVNPGSPDPSLSAFYAWLWEASTSTSCSFSLENGHRWLILKATSAVGTGYESVSGSPYTRYYTGDFADANSPIPKIPSGTHNPQQANSIDFWANWYDSAPPQSAAVNVDGICYPMTLQRGSGSNGAYAALGITGLGSGCHRYFFTFRDSTGNEVTYPSTGSYGIGLTACNDWDLSRPLTCTSSTTPTRFFTVTPCRVVDTRGGAPVGGPALVALEQRTLPFAGYCGVPSDAHAVSINVTVVPAEAGYMTLFPGDSVNPGTSIINFGAGLTRANNGILRLSSDGTGTLAVFNGSAGSNHLIIDVNGYFK